MTYFGDLCGKVRDVHFLWVITSGEKKKKANCKVNWNCVVMENQIIKENNKADSALKLPRIDGTQPALSLS